MPRVKTDEIVCHIREANGLVALAARRLGIHRRTIYRRAEKSQSVRDAIEEARDHMADVAENSLFRAIEQGEAWAVCFFLKTQGKKRGYVERPAVTDATDSPEEMARKIRASIQQMEAATAGTA